MKPLTAILLVLLILVTAFCAWFYIGGTLDAQINRVSANAADYPEAFARIRNAISSGTVEKLYSDEAIGDASDYALADVTVQLTNHGFFDAEWLNIESDQISGDVAMYSVSGTGTDVPAGGMQSMNMKLVLHADSDAVHTAHISYYVFGIERTVDVQY